MVWRRSTTHDLRFFMRNLTRMLASRVRDDQVICAVEGLLGGHLSIVGVVCAGEERVWSSMRF